MTRAAVLNILGGPLEIRDVTLFDPGPDQVVVRTEAIPFCSTDHKSANGELDKVPPTVLGHTVVGYVEDVGATVANVAPGDHVVVPGTPECRKCFYCGIGRPDQCSELFDQGGIFPTVGTLDDGRTFTAAGNVGGYAERVLVSKNQVWRLESDLPNTHLSMLGCGITTGVGAVLETAKVTPGSSVAIVGAGHLGQWMVQGARIADAERIVVIDPHRERRSLALALGATDVVDPTDTDPLEVVRSLTQDRGVDYAFEAAGPEDAFTTAFTLSRRAGTVVYTGFHRLGAEVTLPAGPLALHGRTLHSVQNGRISMGAFIPKLTHLMNIGALDARPILSTTYPLASINDALSASRTYTDVCGIVEPQK